MAWLDVLRCPICAASLQQKDRSVCCEKKHSFDVAREGYLHLLPSGHGRSKIDGDTLPMLQARRRFLSAGFYAPLADALIAALPDSAGSKKEQVVVDVGCGEGYHIQLIQRHLQSTCCFGVDVSRDAVRLAARHRSQPEGPRFFVSDVKQGLPINDGAVDVVVDVFAPRNPADFARMLRPGGALLVAIPQPEHLHELRSLRADMIGIEADKRAHVSQQLAPFFDVDGDRVWRETLALPASAAHDLLHMTPSHHHVEGGDDVGSLSVTASVRVLRFRRR